MMSGKHLVYRQTDGQAGGRTHRQTNKPTLAKKYAHTFSNGGKYQEKRRKNLYLNVLKVFFYMFL